MTDDIKKVLRRPLTCQKHEVSLIALDLLDQILQSLFIVITQFREFVDHSVDLFLDIGHGVRHVLGCEQAINNSPFAIDWFNGR